MLFFFLAEIIVLFLLSRLLTTTVSQLFYKVTRSERLSIWSMSLLFLPGTIIHELSHFFAAKLLLVHTGKLSLLPESYGNSLKLGSVEVGKTDFLRNFLIGIAPFVMGITLIIFLSFTLIQNGWTKDYFLLAVFIYAIFIISNTMFSSRRDLEGALEFIFLIAVIVVLLFFTGVSLTVPVDNAKLRIANQILLVPLGIDIVVIVLLKSVFLLRK